MTDSNALPAFFEKLLAENYGEQHVQRILEGCCAQRPVTMRANTLLATRDEVAAALDAANLAHEPVSWYDDAFIVRGARERDLWDLPVYTQGKIYLQSLSSMIPALVLDARPGEDICDLCAAPGGKTTQIAALTGGKAFLTACEMHAPRAEKLAYNLDKLGARGITVMKTDARNLDDFFSFDRILVDAPCSGSGTLRAGDARMAKRFTPALVQKSQKSQRALLCKALNLLKPGGTLVYSTCSVLPCENEEIVEYALGQAKRRGAYELLPAVSASADEPEGTPAAFFNPNVATDLPLLPTRLEGALCLAPTDLYEGFFVAKIKRIS